ncbi:Imm50 family immunity protein [Streptomyces coacervatus]|nr:Imm50 family immunity protein [Streptomyces coacervatus]MDF2269639.1 Imm50 family immunity protein [Streptomyces coacervatus]
MTVPLIPADPEPLRRLYGDFPGLDEFRLRSINIDRAGPSLTLRIDLLDFPAHPPEDWVANQCDVVQCHIHFLAVDQLALGEWNPSTRARLTTTPTAEPRMIDVSVRGPGVSLDFQSHEQVTIRHISGFRMAPDGSDEVPHHFLSKLDARRFSTIPRTYEKTFYAR